MEDIIKVNISYIKNEKRYDQTFDIPARSWLLMRDVYSVMKRIEDTINKFSIEVTGKSDP